MKNFALPGIVILPLCLWASELPVPRMRLDFDSAMPSGAKVDKADFVPGYRGKAAHFSVNKHNNIKFDGKLTAFDNGTIAFRVKPDLPLYRKTQRTILNIGGVAKELQGVNFSIDGGALAVPVLRCENIRWQPGKFHHIAYTWKLNQADKDFPFRYDVALYVDGRAVAMRTVNRRPIPAGTVTLGAYPVPEYGRPQLFELDGCIDDLEFYNTALTPGEIAAVSKSNAVEISAPQKEKAFRELRSSGNKHPYILQGNGGFTTLTSATRIELMLPRKPHPNDYVAAGELKKYLTKMLNARVVLRRNLTRNCDFRFFISARAAKEGGVSVPEKAEHDEVYIRIGKDHCVLAGDPESGALNGTYTILEHFGVRWYSAGESGEFVPAVKELAVPHGCWRHVPFFQMRRIQLAAPRDYCKTVSSRDLNDWGRRNRLNLGTYAKFHRMVAPHLDKIIPESEFAAHPEYFGMDDRGVRDIPSRNRLNPCTSDPAVVKRIAEHAVSLLKKNPSARYFSIEPIDGGGWCLCERCRKLDVVPGNYTDRIITLANQLTAEIEKAFPKENKAARFFAYQGYANVPEKAVADGNLQVEVTRGTPELIRAWAKYVKNLQRWDYNGWFTFKWGPMPLSLLPEKIKLLKDNHYTGGYFDEGVASVLSLGQPFYYIEAKLMWEPDADLNILLEDFFTNFYGKAAGMMRKCFDLLEVETRRCKSSDDINTEYNRNIFQPYIYPPGMWRKLLAWSKEAMQCVQDDPIRLNRVRTARMTYLLADVARDALIAAQYAADKKHPFHDYIRSRREINAGQLLEAVKLAGLLGINKVRGNCEPGTPEAIVAAWAYLLQIDITPFAEIFYPGTGVSSNQNKKEWQLAFQDEFSRNELGADWKIIRGNWQIKNGALSGRGDAVYINRKFPGDQKLEFDAWVNPDQSPCDLDGILGDMDMSPYGNKGYLFAFGTYGNNFSKINRNKTQILKIPSPVIKPGKKHHIVCEKSGNTLKWVIDGKCVANYKEPFQALTGSYIGFYIDSAGQIDNVKVYTRK